MSNTPKTSHTNPIVGQLLVGATAIDIFHGDTVGACMMRSGVLATRRSGNGQLRGLFCAIGICNDCLVTVDGVDNLRACVTPARNGARVDIASESP